MFEPLVTKLLGRHTCWANTCRADTLRRFLIWSLDFGFLDFFNCVLGCDGKSNERHRKKMNRKKRNNIECNIQIKNK